MSFTDRHAHGSLIGLIFHLAPALLLVACEGDRAEPLDGGWPIDFDPSPAAEQSLMGQRCARREKGGWHVSTGHCEAMRPPQRMSGVWVTAMEESSFFPGDTMIPASNDWRRSNIDIELDKDRVYRMAGAEPPDYQGYAYLISVTGRRTRDPELVDCQGMPHHTVVVYRIESAHYLGPLAEMDGQAYSRDLRARPVTVTQKHGGRWGELEKEAVERCSKRRVEQEPEGGDVP